MWRTAELRWWWRGDPDDALGEWLLRGIKPIEDRRTDLYLADPEMTDVGIKQRGNDASEVKVLIAMPDLSLPANMEGQGEIWVKSETIRLPLTDQNTIGVGKKRRRRILAFEEGGWAEAVSEDSCEEGISLEISAVEALEQKWTTVCLEAFGPEDRIVPLIQSAVTMLGPWPDSVKGPEISGGYPFWLGELSRQD